MTVSAKKINLKLHKTKNYLSNVKIMYLSSHGASNYAVKKNLYTSCSAEGCCQDLAKISSHKIYTVFLHVFKCFTCIRLQHHVQCGDELNCQNYVGQLVKKDSILMSVVQNIFHYYMLDNLCCLYKHLFIHLWTPYHGQGCGLSWNPSQGKEAQPQSYIWAI